MNYILIFIGGGIGSIIRFMMSKIIQSNFTLLSLPVGTIFVNLSGSFIIGFLGAIGQNKGVFNDNLRALIFIGLLGGYTTFSTFSYESLQLIRNNELSYCLIYLFKITTFTKHKINRRKF